MVKVAKSVLLSVRLEKLLKILLTLFAVYLLIQILRKMVGGSWTTEDIILGLLIFNLGTAFTIGLMVVQVRSDHKHLKDQFKSLANDFKSHIGKK